MLEGRWSFVVDRLALVTLRDKDGLVLDVVSVDALMQPLVAIK